MSYDKKVTGRSSSQVSIYDYPEHLNPFYEDENHKRLRFWKIGSSSKGPSQKSGRSNSFTLNGLKDIWAFKSFKLKKKSSTLGINKTSESPPELRRVYPIGDTYNTVDSRSRHTFNVGLGNNFDRGAGYRSSLQNVHSTGADSNSFYRNDRYRSTVQNGYQTLATTSPQRDRYVYSGSITPTPRSRYVTPQSRYGSSQTSINSTNPFDEDDNISRCESIDGVSPRKHRKKRKAPQPPVTSPSISTTQQACTTVEENEVPSKEEMGEILNLTAEIESFVRTHDNDQEHLRESPEKSPDKKKNKSPPIPTRSTTTHITVIEAQPLEESNNIIQVAALPNHQQTVDVVTINELPVEPDVAVKLHHQQKEHGTATKTESPEVEKRNLAQTEPAECRKPLVNSRESPENNEDYPERTSQTPDCDNEKKIQKANSEKQLNVSKDVKIAETVETTYQSPPRIIIRKATEDWELDEEISFNDNNNRVDGEESPKTPISSEVEFILEQDNNPTSTPFVRTSESKANEVKTISVNNESTQEKPKTSKQSLEDSSNVPHENYKITEQSEDVPELKIIESTDDLTESPPISENPDRYKIRFVALKNFSPEPERRQVELRSHNNDEFNVEDVDLPPEPPKRRRSVRDIIASINKSQSLLKINQQPNGSIQPSRAYSVEKLPHQSIPTTVAIIGDNKSLQPSATASNESIIRKFNELDESERKIRKMISDMEKSTIDVPVPVVERFDEFSNNNPEDLFKKCVVRRDKRSQSDASQDESRPSMEWNPLPKPRRSRNLTHEMESGKI